MFSVTHGPAFLTECPGPGNEAAKLALDHMIYIYIYIYTIM